MSNLPRAALHPKLLAKVRKEEPGSIARLVELIEADYQFKLGYLTLAAVVESASATIETTGDERARALAGSMLPLFRQALPKALRAIAYGRAAFEMTMRFDPANRIATVATLDYLPFEYSRLKLDANGRYLGVELHVDNDLQSGERTLLLGPERTWWFALDPTVLEPHGKSRYLGAAYDIYLQRQQLRELEDVWYSRYAIGQAIARAPESDEVSFTPKTGGPETPMDALAAEVDRIESGGVLVLSSATRSDGKYLYEYTPSDGLRDATALENRRQMLDAAALRSLGVPERSVMSEQSVRSYDLAQVHREILFKTCEDILAQLVASFQKHVLDKTVAVNWPESERPHLQLLYQPLGDKRRDLVLDLAKSLATANTLPPLVADGTLDAAKVFELANLPGRDP